MSDSSKPVSVTKTSVPLYLQSGLFYLGWDDDDDVLEEVSIPSSVIKLDDTVENEQELLHLLTTLQYWIVEEASMSIVIYCITSMNPVCRRILERFARDRQYIRELLEATGSLDPWTRALEIGSIICVQVLYENNCSHSLLQSCNAVVNAGCLQCLQYLHKQGFTWDITTCRASAQSGALDCLKYLHKNGCSWDETCAFECSRNGHVKCLNYALASGCPWNHQAAYIAAAKGHVSCVAEFMLLDASPAFLAKLSHIAAAHGQLPVLQYLRPFDCAWDHFVVIFATKAGSLACLEYLHSEGLFCFWEAVPILAAYHGHVDLKYAVEKGCDISFETLCYANERCKEIMVYLKSIGFWYDAYDFEEEENEVSVAHVFDVGSDGYWGLQMFKTTPLKL